VGLAGAILESAGCRLELVEWKPFDQDGYRLTARCDPPEVWPDVRVVAGSTSASLWGSAPYDGEFSGGLPLNHAALFADATVDIALRMVGRRLTPIVLTGQLTSPPTLGS
jgi:hypothetical protein